MSAHLGWFLLIMGAIMVFGRRIAPWLGHLPGDLTFRYGNVTVLVPLGTSILVSILVSLVLGVLAKRL